MGLQDIFVSFPKQDFIILAGVQSPGLATITNISKEFRIDVREPYGFTGATCVWNGAKLAEFTIEFTLWDPLQYAQWQIFSKLLDQPKKSPGGAFGVGFALAYEILHPVINSSPLNVKEVGIKRVTPLMQNDTGLFVSTVDFIEFKKPQPYVAKPTLAIPAIAAKTPTAQDAQEVKMEQLIAQAKSLGGFQ